ncbi:MAG: Smr/MutS family protein [Helicobacteraceae bacterium]|nr:Smr/MutS family protein [Helicobacteraceae bacterium]
MRADELVKALDLEAHFAALAGYFAREKAAFTIAGDIEQNTRFLREIDEAELPEPPRARRLESAASRLAKAGVAKLAEIYDFIRIARFFEALKSRNFEGTFGEYLRSVEIAPQLTAIAARFDLDGNVISEDLRRIKEAIEAQKKRAKTEILRLVSSPKLAPYLVDRQARFVGGSETLLVRGGFAPVLAGRVVDRTPAGFFYVAPRAIAQIEDQIADLENAEIEAISQIEREISDQLFKIVKFLRVLDAAFDRVDSLFARIFFARANDFAIIAPSAKPIVKLANFCHPAIKNPVPISLDFNKPIALVTGVNAGGKTMLLKAVLSAVLMAKLLVPMKINAANSAIGRFKGIEAVIADPQNARDDISTFAGRMAHFSRLLAAENLLIGVDEIELGTDSDEAASLFKIALEHLAAKGSRVIATTHHKRLAALMAANDDVELFAALYDEENQRPNYNFLRGSIGKSYAFETAIRYGVPRAVVNEAKVIYGEDKNKLNELIERSSELERETREKIVSLDNEKLELQRERNLIALDREKLQRDFALLRSNLEAEYKEAIDAAKMAARSSENSERHRAMNEAHNLKQKINAEPKIIESESFSVGDSVKYFTTIGTIISISNDRALIECERGKIYAALRDLKRAVKIPQKNSGVIAGLPRNNNTVIAGLNRNISDEIFGAKVSYEKREKNAKNIKVSVEKPRGASLKLDLHGLRVEEALAALDKFLSDALVAGFDEVLITHGVGGGALARAVKEALKIHPKVKAFSGAPANMGGVGSTIAKF